MTGESINNNIPKYCSLQTRPWLRPPTKIMLRLPSFETIFRPFNNLFAMEIRLKSDPKVFSCPPSLRSDEIVVSPVPANKSPRKYYLENPSLVSPPLISISEFVPRPLAEHLMRKKKSSALGVKFSARKGKSQGRLDEITNMEGAMHTFVTPIMPAVMTGDYIYRHGHGVVKFGEEKKKHRVRNIVLSASIHMDFELPEVMLAVSKLRGGVIQGKDLLEDDDWEILSPEEKQDDKLRMKYDDKLHRHLVYHLTKDHQLPANSKINPELCMSVPKSISYLKDLIKAGGEDFMLQVESTINSRFTKLANGNIVSLELLLKTAIHQVRNEISALESMCPQGYVYTYNPPSIFAARFDATILNRLFLLALKVVSNANTFKNMRVFGFSNYADKAVVPLLKEALREQTHVEVCSKDHLFQGDGGLYDLEKAWSKFEKAGRGAMLVVHNNSDAFGQNIETEASAGSLDGAIGANSSGAASVERGRDDLVNWIL